MGFKIYGQQLIVVQGWMGSLIKLNFILDTEVLSPPVMDRDLAQQTHLYPAIRKGSTRSTERSPARG